MDFIPHAGRAAEVERGALQLPRLRLEEQRHRARASLTMRADVLIAGGGPGRRDAPALRPARGAGVRVRVFDRAVFPRDKLCGDTLNPGALAILRRLGLARGRRGARAADPRHGRHRRARRARRGRVRPRRARARDRARASSTPRSWTQPPRAGACDRAGRARAGADRRDGRRPAAGHRAPHRRGARRRGRARRRSRLRPTGVARGSPSRSASRAMPARPRRWAIGAYFDGVAGAGRRSARCTSAPGATSASRRCPAASPTRVSSSPSRGRARSPSPARCSLASLRRDPALADRFAARDDGGPAGGARAARRRRAWEPACPGCCSPATPAASSIR